MSKRYLPCVIMALNSDLHEESSLVLATHPGAKAVSGVYKGTHEQSYMIPLFDDKKLPKLKWLASQFNKECIMHLDENRMATLIYMDGRADEILGAFRSVSERVAIKRDAYTRDGEAYYVVG